MSNDQKKKLTDQEITDRFSGAGNIASLENSQVVIKKNNVIIKKYNIQNARSFIEKALM